jgi:hypothetical protein
VITSVGSELCEPYILEVYNRLIFTFQKIKQETEGQANFKEVWYFATDYFIRASELMHAVIATIG